MHLRYCLMPSPAPTAGSEVVAMSPWRQAWSEMRAVRSTAWRPPMANTATAILEPAGLGFGGWRQQGSEKWWRRQQAAEEEMDGVFRIAPPFPLLYRFDRPRRVVLHRVSRCGLKCGVCWGCIILRIVEQHLLSDCGMLSLNSWQMDNIPATHHHFTDLLYTQSGQKWYLWMVDKSCGCIYKWLRGRQTKPSFMRHCKLSTLCLTR
jgi:hypothetical protein